MPKKFGALSSTQNPQKLSLTIKAIALSLLPVIHAITGIEITNEQTDNIIDAVFTLVMAGIAIYGYLRSKQG